MNRTNAAAVVVLTVAVMAAVALSGHTSPAAAVPVPEPLAASVPADGSIPAGMGEWTATGALCAGMPVTAGNLRLALDPNVVMAPTDHPALAVAQTETDIIMGEYAIRLDYAAQTVTVAGPAGADALRADVLACVGGGEPAAVPGAWRWDDGVGGWRYVTDPTMYQLPADAGEDA